jgi:L-glutamine-phosphate cytidylyltransferase
MKAIILAAGRGSRMKTATEDRPKCLVELAGHSLFSLQLSALRAGGVDQIAVVGGYRAEKLVRPDVKLFKNARWSETNMVMSLAAAADWLKGSTCLVSYADIFYPAATVRRLAMLQGPQLTIAYDPNWRALWEARFTDPLSDAETFQMTDGNRLVEIGARATSLDQIEGQYMGLLRFTPESWAAVEALLNELDAARRDKLDMTSLLSLLLQRDVDIRAVPTDAGWGEVDSESDLAYYEAEVGSGRIRLPVA